MFIFPRALWIYSLWLHVIITVICVQFYFFNSFFSTGHNEFLYGADILNRHNKSDVNMR